MKNSPVQKLKATARFGMRPGLARIRALLKELGNPQRGLKVVHVAGTNGKGSVCSLLESCLREAGWRTGLFTSPHLVEERERIQVMGRSVSRESFEAGLRKVLAAARKVERRRGVSPTYFEMLTALAFERFADAGLDLVVLETGLGGRLDSTNVIARPLLTIITNIDLDHTQWLGETVQAIAGEKAGIIKPGVDLITAAQGAALPVIRAKFNQVQSKLAAGKRGKMSVMERGQNWSGKVIRTVLESRAGQEVDMTIAKRRHLFFLPLLGSHQLNNLACVMAGLDRLAGQGYGVPEAARVAGVARVRWPGRLQLADQKPRLLLDGAHNPAGSRALAKALSQLKRGRTALVLGVLKDKDWEGILKPLLPLAARIFLAKPNDERGLDAEAAFSWLPLSTRRKAGRYPTVSKAFAAARAWARSGDTVVVAGSLYTVGEAMAQLKMRA